MKSKVITSVCVLFMLISSPVFAQDSSSFFIGKWKLQIEGTPGGGNEMTINIAREDGKLKGYFTNDGQENRVEFSSIEEKKSSITIYFTAGDYDVSIDLNRVDADHAKGSMLGMFDVTGERITGNK
ncbi:MAG: hypothetical protein LBJ60_04750 [Tannerellaceae bacterium]|jgi:hypothetical protein|nr:hypothetical protein [Tannerellaceae bacterium]